MRTLALIGTLAVLLVGGAVTIAASSGTFTPAPTPGAPTQASPYAANSSTSARKGSSSATTSNGPWQASLQPLDVITGSVKLTQEADGTGTLTLSTAGLGGAAPWRVYLDKGRITSTVTAANHDFVFRSGRDFTMFTSEVVTIQLTKAQMDRLTADLSSAGVVTATVTDGIRHSVAYLQ